MEISKKGIAMSTTQSSAVPTVKYPAPLHPPEPMPTCFRGIATCQKKVLEGKCAAHRTNAKPGSLLYGCAQWMLEQDPARRFESTPKKGKRSRPKM